ncbi:MAG TPA: hypothetical protein VJH94_04855 [Candidatus Paceibacterota bacterium]
MKKEFYLEVWDYGVLVLMVKMGAEKIPKNGDEIEVDFQKPDVEFIDGVWSRGIAVGQFSFIVTGNSLSVEDWDGLPIVESQIGHEDEV